MFNSLTQPTRALVEQWLAWDKNEATRNEIIALATADNEAALTERLGKRIAFGTSGLRAKMQAGFAFMNDLVILQTSQGLCRYLEAQFPDLRSRGIAVGFDGRHHSHEFALRAASTFVSQGVPVRLFRSTCPTPHLVYTIPRYHVAAAVMVTASHNPKADNGFKVYWANGAAIIPPHDRGIAEAIEANLVPWSEAPALDATALAQHALVSDPLDDVLAAYTEQVSAALCHYRDVNTAHAVPIVYTAMHGVGYIPVLRLFAAFGLPAPVPVEEQVHPDPEFPTVTFPNPEEGKGALKLAMARADGVGARVILATDPDADRLGVAERSVSGEWRIFSGNELGTIIGDWALQRHRERVPGVAEKDRVLISTAVSSRMLASYAEAEGVHFEETLTGFKWLGNKAHDLMNAGKHFVFGFEEAIGFMVGDACLDKDGVRAAAVVAEMVGQLAQRGATLASQLDSLYERYGYHHITTNYFFCYDPARLRAIFDKMRGPDHSAPTYPTSVGGFAVARVRDQTTGYDSAASDKRTVLPVTPDTEMITFFFANGAVATIRGSGTEPKLKYYVEVRGSGPRDAIRETHANLSRALVAELLQPEANNLVAPKVE